MKMWFVGQGEVRYQKYAKQIFAKTPTPTTYEKIWGKITRRTVGILLDIRKQRRKLYARRVTNFRHPLVRIINTLEFST